MCRAKFFFLFIVKFKKLWFSASLRLICHTSFEFQTRNCSTRSAGARAFKVEGLNLKIGGQSFLSSYSLVKTCRA